MVQRIYRLVGMYWSWFNGNSSEQSNLFKISLIIFSGTRGTVTGKSGTGTTFKAITQNVIKNIEVPVPDLYEQERIVSKIEELFSGLDASVAELQTAKEKLKIYRQAVLKEALEGDYPCVRLKEIATAFSGYAFKSKKYSSNGRYVGVKNRYMLSLFVLTLAAI